MVFATAYAEYAIEGYEVQALDYLLKPINVEKIVRVLKRFLEKQPEDAAYTIVESDGESIRLNLEDILYVEASKREVIIYLSDNILNINMSLSEFIELVDERFVLTHRSYLVNLEHISRLLRQDVELSNDEKIPLSRSGRLRKSKQHLLLITEDRCFMMNNWLWLAVSLMILCVILLAIIIFQRKEIGFYKLQQEELDEDAIEVEAVLPTNARNSP